jgi:hypothetical protein
MIGRPFRLLTEAILTPSLVFTYWISGQIRCGVHTRRFSPVLEDPCAFSQ